MEPDNYDKIVWKVGKRMRVEYAHTTLPSISLGQAEKHKLQVIFLLMIVS